MLLYGASCAACPILDAFGYHWIPDRELDQSEDRRAIYDGFHLYDRLLSRHNQLGPVFDEESRHHLLPRHIYAFEKWREAVRSGKNQIVYER